MISKAYRTSRHYSSEIKISSRGSPQWPNLLIELTRFSCSQSFYYFAESKHKRMFEDDCRVKNLNRISAIVFRKQTEGGLTACIHCPNGSYHQVAISLNSIRKLDEDKTYRATAVSAHAWHHVCRVEVVAQFPDWCASAPSPLPINNTPCLTRAKLFFLLLVLRFYCFSEKKNFVSTLFPVL